MKKLFIFFLFLPAMVMAQELATFSMTTSISGMQVPDRPPGEGDRALTFELAFDATDLDVANALFYEHIKLILGPDEIEAFQAMTEDMVRSMRDRRSGR